MNFKYQKPYALIELSIANGETHVVVDGEHYEFSDVRFYVDADLMFDRSEALEAKGVKTILLNTHALMSHFISHDVECMSAELGINVNYGARQ